MAACQAPRPANFRNALGRPAALAQPGHISSRSQGTSKLSLSHFRTHRTLGACSVSCAERRMSPQSPLSRHAPPLPTLAFAFSPAFKGKGLLLCGASVTRSAPSAPSRMTRRALAPFCAFVKGTPIALAARPLSCSSPTRAIHVPSVIHVATASRTRQAPARRRPPWACRAFERDIQVTWTSSLSPYETLGVDRDATLEDVKAGYRRMAKTFHPDVYTGSPPLEEGESAESRFIQIQAAYELLTSEEQRREYDLDTRTNPNKASKAWREWVLRKKKAFEQRGEVAFSAWAEQQRRELSLKARQTARAKDDPEEEKRQLAKEKAATIAAFETTLKRHTLVLKKRDLERQRKEEASRKRLVADLLLAEGLELEDE